MKWRFGGKKGGVKKSTPIPKPLGKERKWEQPRNRDYPLSIGKQVKTEKIIYCHMKTGRAERLWLNSVFTVLWESAVSNEKVWITIGLPSRLANSIHYISLFVEPFIYSIKYSMLPLYMRHLAMNWKYNDTFIRLKEKIRQEKRQWFLQKIR